ncbi:MAG: toprim domain-containing protein, partial [Spirochaetales bacterium]|nr:toprim domain-containing protein [Candidatus Physcosoma equi]
HQAGFTSAVASLGTSFTNEQCINMKKWFSAVKGFDLLFDSDEAGQTSTERALLIINGNGLEQRVHKFSTAKDASELLERGGKEAVQKEFSPSVTGFDYLVQKNLTRYDVKNARGKSDFVKSLSEYLSGCSSEVERDSYILTISSRLGLTEQAIKEDLKHSGKRMTEMTPQPEIVVERVDERQKKRGLSIDLFTMLYLANHRNLFRQYRGRINFGDLEDRDAQELYMAIENAMRDGIESNELFLTYVTIPELKDMVAASMALDDYSSSKVSALDEAIDRIRLRSLERRRDILTSQLRLSTMDVEEATETFERKLELDGQIAKLKERLISLSTNNSGE